MAFFCNCDGEHREFKEMLEGVCLKLRREMAELSNIAKEYVEKDSLKKEIMKEMQDWVKNQGYSRECQGKKNDYIGKKK